MSTYNPLPVPRRSKSPTLLTELRYQMLLLHFRYEMNTGLYVMSSGEKLAFNIFFLGLATLLLSVVYYCTPMLVIHSLHKAVGLVGSSVKRSAYKIEVRTTILQEIVAGDHIASLLPSYAGANASMVSVPGL